MNLNMLLPLVAYLLLVFGVAFYAYRQRQKGDFLSDYYIGGRSMSGFVLAMTTAATYVGASSFIGGPGAAYKYGLGWVLLAMIQVPVVWLSLGILGKKLTALARQHNSLTINDVLLARYKNPWVVWISCFALLLSFFAMMTVQFIGAGRLLETTLGIPYQTSILIFAITVGIYTFIGGFRAVVLTDTIQGLIMVVGTLLLLGGVIYAAGSIHLAVDTLEKINPKLITPYGAENMLDATFMSSFWVLVCFGLIGLPHTALRSMAYKNDKALHKGMLIGTIVVTILMLGIHLAGALGRAVLPALDIPDQVIPKLMITVLPPTVAGIFIAAPMAAIMSSIDSMLIQSSSTLIKDFYLTAYPHQQYNELKIKRLSTIITITLTLLLIVAAIHPPKMLIWLNLLSLGALEATFLWVLILGLYWKKANATGAIASMIFGSSSYILLSTFQLKLIGLHPIIPALLLGLISFIIGNNIHRFTKNTLS